MSLEDLEPFGMEWELEQNERMYGEAPLESEHSMAHREAAQLGLSCPFDCEPDHGWTQVGEDEWAPDVPEPEADNAAADAAEAREFTQEPPW